MKESKAVYVTKRDIRENLLYKDYFYANNNIVNTIEVNKYKLTNDVGIQYNSKRDNIFYAHRNFSNGRKYYDHDLRYFNPIPKQIYTYSRSKSFTDIGVGSVKALQKKKVKKIYLPETDDRGVGSSDLSSFIIRMQSLQNKNKTAKQYRTVQSYYESKRTSSKCVGGAIDYRPECLVSAKVSPIVHTQSGSTSPKDPGLRERPKESKDSKDIEIETVTVIEKQLVTTDTQFEEPEEEIPPKKIEVIVPEPIVEVLLDNSSKSPDHSTEEVVEIVEVKPPDPIPSEPKLEVVLPEKRSVRPEPLKGSFSSDSLVQHVHNLEQPSEYSKQRDPMENKMEREYRKMFASISRDEKTEGAAEKQQIPQKSTSLFRRRFTAIRKSLGKKDSKNAVVKQASVPSVRDASITSDPPSLEERSFSSINGYPTSKKKPQRKASYKKSYTGKKSSKTWSKANAIDSEYGQGVKGMFKLWGKKFNLDDTSDTREDITQPSSFEDKPKEDEPREKGEEVKHVPAAVVETIDEQKTFDKDKEKKEGKKFFFFKKKHSKDKAKNPSPTYKSRKGVTTGRCEVKDGLSIRMGAARTPSPAKSKTPPPRPLVKKVISSSVDNYEDVIRTAWLMKYLSNPNESRNSVKVRWNNKTYATSSSTIFELMGNVYKNTGVILKSKSEITTDASSTWSYNRPNINFVQHVEAWMIPKTVLDHKPPVPKNRSENIVAPIMSKSKSQNENKNIEVTFSDQKWIIDKSKAFAHKIEVVLHSKNFVKLHDPKTSADYLRIDIPKGFFSDTSSDDPQQEHTSEEEVYNIVEYESANSGPELKHAKIRSKVSNSGDHSDEQNIQVTVSVKSAGMYEESKIMETVIKRPPVHRDVVIQGSNVYIPKMCDVIGVGIITQRDVREVGKSRLKVMEYISDDESGHSLRRACPSIQARNCLDEYYRHWEPLGLDIFPWCYSDSHMQCCSEQNSRCSYHNIDVSKSCPNVFEEYITMVSSYSSGQGCQNPNHPCYDNDKKKKKKTKEKVKEDKKKDVPYRVLPKDSLEVFKKRKIYAVEKSKWVDDCSTEPYSIPSNADTGVQGKVCSRTKKVGLPGTPEQKKQAAKKDAGKKSAKISPNAACTIPDEDECCTQGSCCAIVKKSPCYDPCSRFPPPCPPPDHPPPAEAAADGDCPPPPPPPPCISYGSVRREKVVSHESSPPGRSPPAKCPPSQSPPGGKEPQSKKPDTCLPCPKSPPCPPPCQSNPSRPRSPPGTNKTPRNVSTPKEEPPCVCPPSPPLPMRSALKNKSPPRPTDIPLKCPRDSPTSPRRRHELHTSPPRRTPTCAEEAPPIHNDVCRKIPRSPDCPLKPPSCPDAISPCPPLTCPGPPRRPASPPSQQHSSNASSQCSLPERQKACPKRSVTSKCSQTQETRTPRAKCSPIQTCPPTPPSQKSPTRSVQIQPSPPSSRKRPPSPPECPPSPPKRPPSPPICPPSPPKRPPSPPECPPSPPKQQPSPPKCPPSPPKQQLSPPKCPPSPPKQQSTPPKCPPSPPKQQSSPPKRPPSPPKCPPSPPKRPPSPPVCPPIPPKAPPENAPKMQALRPKCPTGIKLSNTGCMDLPKPRKYGQDPCPPCPPCPPRPSPPAQHKSEPGSSPTAPLPPKTPPGPAKIPPCPPKTPPGPPKTQPSPPKSPPCPTKNEPYPHHTNDQSPNCRSNRFTPPKSPKAPHGKTKPCPPESPTESNSNCWSDVTPSPPASPLCPPKPAKCPPKAPSESPPCPKPTRQSQSPTSPRSPSRCPHGMKLSNTDCVTYPKHQKYGLPCPECLCPSGNSSPQRSPGNLQKSPPNPLLPSYCPQPQPCIEGSPPCSPRSKSRGKKSRFGRFGSSSSDSESKGDGSQNSQDQQGQQGKKGRKGQKGQKGQKGPQKDTSNTAECCRHQPCCPKSSSGNKPKLFCPSPDKKSSRQRSPKRDESPCYHAATPPSLIFQQPQNEVLCSCSSPKISDRVMGDVESQKSSCTQSSFVASVSSQCEQCKDGNYCSERCPHYVAKSQSEPKQCPYIDLGECLDAKPKSQPNMYRKNSGLYLKKIPRKISDHTRANILSSKEGNAVDDNVSTHEMRGNFIKIKDEDQITLIERKDYGKQKQTVLSNIYNDQKMAGMAAPITINEMNSVERETKLNESKSSDSVVNMIEINFKLRVIQGDKTTEINIANDEEESKPTEKKYTEEKETTNTKKKSARIKPEHLDDRAKDVYIVKERDETEELNPKNDLNIRIVIKNYKPKTESSKEKKAVDDFAEKISKKFNTVSTGYSVDFKGEHPEDACFSIHRATIDLTTSERSKESIPSTDKIAFKKSEVKFKEGKKISNEIMTRTLEGNNTELFSSGPAISVTENLASVTEVDSKISANSEIVHIQSTTLPTLSEPTKSVSSGLGKTKSNRTLSEHSNTANSKRPSLKNIHHLSSRSLRRSSRFIPKKWSKSDDEYMSTDKTYQSTELVTFKTSKKAVKLTDIYKSQARLSFTDTDDRDTSLGNKTSDEPTSKSLGAKTSEDRTDYGKTSEDPDSDTKTSEVLIEKIPTDELDYVTLEKSAREEKKEMLKQVFDSTNYFKKPKTKNKIQKLKDMLKALLTSDDDSEPDHAYQKPAIDSPKCPWNPKTKHNSDSLNNYFEGGSMMVSQTVMHPHIENYHSSVQSNKSAYSEDEEKPENKTCLCSNFAEKLNLGNLMRGGCCCRNPPELVNEQISCNFINELSLEDYSYFAPSVECVHCQTNNSRYKSSIHCAKIVSISSRKSSFVTPQSQKTSFIAPVSIEDHYYSDSKPLSDRMSYHSHKIDVEYLEHNSSREADFLHAAVNNLEMDPVSDKMSIRTDSREREFKDNLSRDGYLQEAVENPDKESVSAKTSSKTYKRELNEKPSHESHFQEMEVRRYISSKTVDRTDEGKSTTEKTTTDRSESNKKKKKHHTKLRNQADVLQMYETKKAVLEIYAEKTVTDEGEHMVAKLPKFVRDTESELYSSYEQLERNNYKSVYKRNFVMMCIGR